VSVLAVFVAAVALWRTEVRDRQARRDRLGPRIELRHVNGGSGSDGAYIQCRIANDGGGTARNVRSTLHVLDGHFDHPRPLATLPAGEEERIRFLVRRAILETPTGDLQIPELVMLDVEWADDFGGDARSFKWPPDG